MTKAMLPLLEGIPQNLMPGEEVPLRALRELVERLNHQEAAIELLDWHREYGDAVKDAAFECDWEDGRFIYDVEDFEWGGDAPEDEAMEEVDTAMDALDDVMNNHLGTDTEYFATCFIAEMNLVHWNMARFTEALHKVSSKRIDGGEKWFAAYLAREQELKIDQETPKASGARPRM